MPRSFHACASLALAAAATVLAGCNRSEKIPTTTERLAAVSQKQETEKDFYLPRKNVDYMRDLKSLKDSPAKPEPEAKAAPARATSTASAPPAAVAPAAPQPAAAAPATTTAPAASSASAAAAPPPAAPPPAQVASAAPSARSSAPLPTTQVTVLAREAPEFPREATRAGVESGTVRARLTISASGEVTNVAIVQASPAKVFDRAVQGALSRWKFNAGAEGRSYDTEITFQR
ncbi:MAG TPA: energy transducer TonB [Usitatibacteraceae bacterium]|nr:energy transducer TonB [Usitatibacteraceae bacterium]